MDHIKDFHFTGYADFPVFSICAEFYTAFHFLLTCSIDQNHLIIWFSLCDWHDLLFELLLYKQIILK